MTRPRSELIDRENGGFYHLFNRCVRQAWLCGEDPNTGENFDHRRGWIERRLLALTDVFAIDVYAYAVMSNHYHIVVNYCPARAHDWSDEEVARRWLTVFGRRPADPQARAAQEAALLADPARLGELRRRLGDLSWYMRALNENIARRANAEEGSHGTLLGGALRVAPASGREGGARLHGVQRPESAAGGHGGAARRAAANVAVASAGGSGGDAGAATRAAAAAAPRTRLGARDHRRGAGAGDDPGGVPRAGGVDGGALPRRAREQRSATVLE